MKLIALVGMPGSGKSVAADFFRSRNIPVLRFGDETDIGLKDHGLERNEKNERWFREKIRKELGMAAMAIRIEPRIKKAMVDSETIVLDGLYSWEEYVYLKKKFPYLMLVCIWAPPFLRYNRLATRKVRSLTEEESRSRDIAEIENLNKGGPIAVADDVIVNSTTKRYLHSQLEKYI